MHDIVNEFDYDSRDCFRPCIGFDTSTFAGLMAQLILDGAFVDHTLKAMDVVLDDEELFRPAIGAGKLYEAVSLGLRFELVPRKFLVLCSTDQSIKDGKAMRLLEVFDHLKFDGDKERLVHVSKDVQRQNRVFNTFEDVDLSAFGKFKAVVDEFCPENSDEWLADMCRKFTKEGFLVSSKPELPSFEQVGKARTKHNRHMDTTIYLWQLKSK